MARFSYFNATHITNVYLPSRKYNKKKNKLWYVLTLTSTIYLLIIPALWVNVIYYLYEKYIKTENIKMVPCFKNERNYVVKENIFHFSEEKVVPSWKWPKMVKIKAVRRLFELRNQQFEYRNVTTDYDTFITIIRLRKGQKLIEVDSFRLILQFSVKMAENGWKWRISEPSWDPNATIRISKRI